MGISTISKPHRRQCAVSGVSAFQSPMGISTISKRYAISSSPSDWTFQSPMGISTISKPRVVLKLACRQTVSIPNGDKHDFKTARSEYGPRGIHTFQSPMGISTISKRKNGPPGATYRSVSIPNGDKHDFKTHPHQSALGQCEVSIPNGDKHDFKTASPLDATHLVVSFNPQWG